MKPSGLLQRQRLSWQMSTCTITRRDGESTWDPDVNDYVTVESEVYSGPCHIRPMTTEQRFVQAGERAVSLRSYLVEVPMTVEAQVDDTLTVDTSPDAHAVGLTLRVVDAPKNELGTVRVLECEEAA